MFQKNLQFLFLDSCFDEEDDDEKEAFDTAVCLLKDLIFSSRDLPTNRMEAVATENQKMIKKLKKAEAERKEYETKAEAARQEKEHLELEHKLEIEKIEKEKLQKVAELLAEKDKLSKEALEDKKRMIEKQAEKEKTEALAAQEEELKAQREKNEQLDLEAKRKGFSWWDVVPVAGAIRRAVMD